MSDWRRAIDEEIDAIADDLRAVRRHLHVHPEPSREEFQTTLFLARRLDEAAIPYRLVPSQRGIVAGPERSPGTRCIALRADMDALRIQDAKDVAYRSARDGVMHACGHDAHSAMALGAALALSRCAQAVPWPVPWRVIFQPAEEVGEGAFEMVEAGAVADVEAIVALHVAPDLGVGRVALRHGVMTAFCQDILVEVRGRGGHAARPHLTIDPIAAAAQLVTAIYQALPRSIDARDPVVVSFGAIAGGSNSNVIPEHVFLRGTLRTMGRASAIRVRERLAQIARGIAEATRTEIDLAFGLENDAVVNDVRVSETCIRAAGEVVGAEKVENIPLPSMGAEDFSGYLDRTPGCLLRLGVAPNAEGGPPLHSPHFDIDERALAIGAKVLAHSAILLAQKNLTTDNTDKRR
jgi:amidohydrolase